MATDSTGIESTAAAKKSANKKAAKKATAKRAAAKKTAVKRGAAKRAAAKTSDPSAPKRKRTPGEATLRKQQEKLEEERAQYLAKIEANEARLRERLTATAQPLTPEQLDMTNDILKRQRERLAELDAYERSRQADGDPR